MAEMVQVACRVLNCERSAAAGIVHARGRIVVHIENHYLDNEVEESVPESSFGRVHRV